MEWLELSPATGRAKRLNIHLKFLAIGKQFWYVKCARARHWNIDDAIPEILFKLKPKS